MLSSFSLRSFSPLRSPKDSALASSVTVPDLHPLIGAHDDPTRVARAFQRSTVATLPQLDLPPSKLAHVTSAVRAANVAPAGKGDDDARAVVLRAQVDREVDDGARGERGRRAGADQVENLLVRHEGRDTVTFRIAQEDTQQNSLREGGGKQGTNVTRIA